MLKCSGCGRVTEYLYKDLKLKLLPVEKERELIVGDVIVVPCSGFGCSDRIRIELKIVYYVSNDKIRPACLPLCFHDVRGGMLQGELNILILDNLSRLIISGG